MFNKCHITASLLIVIGLLSMPGCGGSQPAGPGAAKTAKDDHHDDGPHGGMIMDFAKYHAELVHDEAARSVTVYILGDDAKSSVAIDATEFNINVSLDKQPKQYRLSPSPDAGDAAGKSSRFVSADAELCDDLDRKGVAAELAATIDGKPYRSKIAAHHD